MSGNAERCDRAVYASPFSNRFHKKGCPYMKKPHAHYDIEHLVIPWLAQRWNLKPCKHCKPRPEWLDDL